MKCDKVDRIGFIKKVYCILLTQLSITAAAIWLVSATAEGICFQKCTFYPGNIAYWMQKNWGVLIFAFVTAISTEITIICCRKPAKKVPLNYLLLLVFTLCQAYIVSNLCSYYALSQPGVIVSAGLGTVLITFACTIYAFTTKTDFTLMGGLIFILCMSVIVLGVFTWVFRMNSFLYNCIISLCIFVFGIFLIYDTQLIVGKGRHKLSIDDYVIAALILYVDIITIFVYLLSLLSEK